MIEIPVSQRDERPGDGRQGPDLVGREADLDRIRSFLSTTRTDGGALWVSGDPGVGKTELLNAAATIASAAGMRVLRAAGVEFEAGISFSGLNQLLLPLFGALRRLPVTQRESLNVALGLGEGVPPSRLVVSNAALMLLRQAAASRPLLLVIDDLPWLDRASAEVLSFVARRLHGSRIGLIGASRTGEEEFFDHLGLPELVVEPLGEAASGQLLDTRYPHLSSTVRGRILVDAQGNALALLELPAALGPSLRRSANALPSTLPLGRRLQAMFRSRITDLPAGTRRLLLLIALDGTGDVRVLEAGVVPNSGLGDLSPAEQAGLASMDAVTHRLEFRHPLMRSTVVDLSTAEERRTAHRALAEVWADQPDRRAWHLAEATVEPDEVVAAQLEAAAARILARGDAAGCMKALTRASEVSPASADRQRRLGAAAYVGAEVAGDLSNAARVLAELRRGGTEVETSLQVTIAAAAFLTEREGDIATAHRLLVGALDGREGPLDAREIVVAEALQLLLVVCTYGSRDDMWRQFDAAMSRADGVPLSLSLMSTTFADPVHADPEALEALDAAIGALASESSPTQIMRIGTAATYVDRLEGCRDPLWRVVRDARQGGAVAAGVVAMLQLVYDDMQTGSWDEAEQLADEAMEICLANGYENMTRPTRYRQVVLAAARGDDDRVRQLGDELLHWETPRGVRAAHWRVWQARGLAALGRGDFETAYQQACLISPPGTLPSRIPNVLNVLMDLVEAAMRTGRQAEAAAHVAAMQQANLAGISSRLALVVGASAAMVAPDDRALDLFQETLALPGVERWQFDYARVRLAYGERLRRNRAMTESRVQLNAASAIFERLGARPWVDRTTAELRASGQAKPRAGDYVLDRLTPQEFEIATLAASGLTNKQIAERLFLSHRTVGGHLHRAFPKLGVSTRAALRDALESLPPEQRPLD